MEAENFQKIPMGQHESKWAYFFFFKFFNYNHVYVC